MAPIIAYLVTAAALLLLAHRVVRPLSVRAATLLVLLPCAFCGWALIANRVYAPIDLPYDSAPLTAWKDAYGVKSVSTGMHTDVHTEFIPWRKTVQWSLARGEWGLWNPFAMSGDVLLAGQQAAVYSPLTLIAALMPVPLSFTFTAAITFFVAALTAFLLARELGCGEIAAFTAAAGWAFATPIVLFLLTTMGQTWAWCPLLLLAVHRLVENPSLRSASLLTFAFTIILLSGHPESAVLCVFVGMLYGAFELVRRRAFVKAPLFAAGAAVVALLLSAIQILPFYEVLPYTVEQQHRMIAVGDMHPAVPWQWSLARASITLLPYLHERQWNVSGWKLQMLELEIGAVGSLILALAVYAVVRVRNAASWFFGALALFSLLVHASWEPLMVIMRTIPVLSMTLTDRLSFGFALSACMLAAMGVEHLQRRGAAIAFTVMFVLIAAGNWWAMHTPLVMHGALKFGAFNVWAEVAGLAIAAVMVGWGGLKPALRFALFGLIVMQRVISDGGMYHSFAREQAYPRVPLFKALGDAREPYRVVGTGTILLPQLATMYGLEDVRGVPSLQLLGYAETYSLWCVPQPGWFQRVDDLSRPFLSFLNVRYAFSDQPAPPGWREVARDRGTFLHENTRVLGRAFVPRSVSVGYPRQLSLSYLTLHADYAERAWIETGNTTPEVRANGPGRATTRAVRGGYAIRAEMENDGWVVTSIPNWPGWRARIDGHDAPVRVANHAFLAVHVPKGTHDVRLTYLPRGFVWGTGITIVTLVMIVLGAASVMLLRLRYE